jgi:mannose/fructose/N-acetylgalactosamine-specific phosphotransferase system component IID
MTPRTEALLRLYGVQAAWTYERMSGIGVGHAAAPMLREHYATRPVEVRREAVARSAEFFNSHPYLAGVAVGAVVKAERDGVPGPVISRLRTALSGPLGAIGDQLIWAGEVPALIGFTLALVPWFGIWAVLLAVVIHNLIRFRLTAWGLDLGLREGLNVGTALQRSWLPRRAEDAQRLAAFAIGLAIPLAAWGLLSGLPRRGTLGVLVVVLVGSFLAVAPATRSRVTGLRVGLALLALALIFVGEFA